MGINQRYEIRYLHYKQRVKQNGIELIKNVGEKGVG